MLAIQQEDGLCGLRRQIFDVLTLIENDVMELLFAELLNVVAYQCVSGQYELFFHGLRKVALVTVVSVVSQLWCKLLQLVLPVEQQ